MSFAMDTPVKAVRKAKHCDGCGTMVEVGQSATRWAGVTDGQFGTAIYHPECRVAEIAYNRLIDSNWDEWVSLTDREPEDTPWLIDEHPRVAARLGLVQGDAA